MAQSSVVTDLTATSYSYAAVHLAWSTFPGAVSYQIQYRKKGTQGWTNGPLVKAPTNNAPLTGLAMGLTYEYRVIQNGV